MTSFVHLGLLALSALAPTSHRGVNGETKPGVPPVAEPCGVDLQPAIPTAWPEATDSIRFELEQAGYKGEVDGALRLALSRNPDRWRLDLDLRDRDRTRHWSQQGSLTDPVDVIAMHAVGLVDAACNAPSELAVQAEQPPTNNTETNPTQTRKPPPAEATPTIADGPWRVGGGLALSLIGIIGPRVEASHHWPSLELGLAGEVGFVEGPMTGIPDDENLQIDHFRHTVPRLALNVAYLSPRRPSFRFLVGTTIETIFPVSTMHQSFNDPATQLDGTEAGLLLVPGLELGVLISPFAGLSLRIAARAGPTVELIALESFDDEPFRFPAATATLSLSALFGRAALAWGED